jgi:hypothetical protein
MQGAVIWFKSSGPKDQKALSGIVAKGVFSGISDNVKFVEQPVDEEYCFRFYVVWKRNRFLVHVGPIPDEEETMMVSVDPADGIFSGFMVRSSRREEALLLCEAIEKYLKSIALINVPERPWFSINLWNQGAEDFGNGAITPSANWF